MTGTPAHEFRIGSVLSRGVRILAGNIVPFGLLALAFTAPPYIYVLAATGSELASSGNLAILIAGILLQYLLTAALVYGTIRELRGSRASLMECVRRGLGLVFPVVGVAVLAGLATGLASLALVVPGLIVAAMLWVAVPVAVVERPSITAALRRSAELTKGYRWQVFGIIVIVFGLDQVVLAAGSAIVGDDMPALLVVSWIVSAIFGAAIAVVSAVSYHDLRIAKEGLDPQQIAKVFD
jgi:hypothetical protein